MSNGKNESQFAFLFKIPYLHRIYSKKHKNLKHKNLKHNRTMKTTYYFIAAIAFLSFGAQSQMRYVATTGNDTANNCNLPGNPCASVAHAVSVASANDSILVGAGSYTFGSVVNINLQGIVLTAMDPANKPEIIAGDPDVISVTAPDVTISNIIFKMGLLLNGKRGIVGTGNFDNITIENNEFISTTVNGIWSPNGMVFGSYAISLQAPVGVPTQATIQDNIIRPLTADYANFGRGLGLGFNHVNGLISTPHGDFTGNDITAYFPIQAIYIEGNLNFQNNNLKGLTMFNIPRTNATVLLDNNIFDAVNNDVASYLYAILDIRAVNNASIVVSNNEFINYTNIGLLSMASRNIEVLNNTFSPSATATNFISVLANTKLMTAGTQNNTYSDGITVKGNTFNAGALNEGIALTFADHYGLNTPAFDVTVVGGPAGIEKNSFSSNLRNFIVLDSAQGSSNTIPLWTAPNVTAETIMQPVSQDVNAWLLHNNYGLPTEVAIEEKNTDSLDNALLGKIILGDLSTIGITELNVGDFKIYPNPNNGELNISLKDFEGSINLRIVDLSGRELMHTNFTATGNDFNFPVDCTKLPQGNYFLKIKTESGSFTQKFVKL